MKEALLLVQVISAAVTAGVNMLPFLEKVSSLIHERHEEGKTFTEGDLKALFEEGDAQNAVARRQFEDTLADPNTPKLDA